ncbi:MAG TPA: vWA domain-containing protein [Spirochaetota bacterium]|nr:vWA domain-containing protein [Spirochaetota bacterium]HQO01744.1 vWA domain-containing protein [Spirochaetota bacterium]
MADYMYTISKPERPSLDFFQYWDSLGFFDNIQAILPPQFFVIFEIARVIFTSEFISDALSAIEDISKEEKIEAPDRDETILINRLERISPLSDNMEIDQYRTIYDMKKSLPRELALDDDIFDIKLFTKSLLVQRFYETEADKFKPISTLRDESGKDANKFEQKFYLLLDSSRSMDMRMRLFFSKCLVAEFLRRKFNSNAKIFFRQFDSSIGKLIKLDKKEDFPFLVEEILYATTGGTSTNLQDAVYQAIDDINFDKEMINAEILVVTDGISKIEKFKLKEKLGDVKLNVLKIGKDLVEANFYDIQQMVSHNNLDFDPSRLNINDIKRKMEKSDDETVLSVSERRAYRGLLDYSERVFQDLKEVANRFIEIPDLEPSRLFELTDEGLDFIETSADEYDRMNFDGKPIDEMTRLYKKAYFLSEYIELLLEHGNNINNHILTMSYEKLKKIRQRMLNDPLLYDIITREKGYDEDKKTMKLSRREARKRLKEMQLQNKALSTKEMKQAQMLMVMDVGEGSMGQFLKLILVKLWQLITKVAGLAFRKKSGGEEDEE